MSIYLDSYGVYCTHCNFTFVSHPHIFEHPLADPFDEGELKERIKTCPHAGKPFYYPQLRELK